MPGSRRRRGPRARVVPELDRYVSEFGRFESGRKADWIHPARLRALGCFREHGFPTMEEEAWRYTRVAPLAAVPFEPPASGPEALTARQLGSLLCGNLSHLRLVFVDGRFSAPLSSPGPGLSSLAQAMTASPPLVDPPRARLDVGAHPFAALNTAFLRDGAFVHVPKGALLPDPVQLVFVSTASAAPTVSHPRVLVVAEAGSRATVIETYLGAGKGAYFTNAVTELVAGPDASLQHVKLQLEAEGAFHLGLLQSRQERGSAVSSHLVSFGGALSRNEVHVLLSGEGASSILNGLYVAAGTQHMDALTAVDHASPRCTSQELYKGILHDRARGVFFGRIRVRPGAQRTDAHQTNRNLLLSPEAEVSTRPQLQIDADDVACTHGATVGRLDEAAIFYLRSRGISPDSARSLLTHAFAEDIFDRIPVPGVRDQLTAHTCAWLTRHLGGGVSR